MSIKSKYSNAFEVSNKHQVNKDKENRFNRPSTYIFLISVFINIILTLEFVRYYRILNSVYDIVRVQMFSFITMLISLIVCSVIYYIFVILKGKYKNKW